MKKFDMSLLYTFGIILGFTLLITLFNYFNILSYKVVVVFKIIIPVLSLFVGGFILGKKSSNKGWLEGLKYGILVIVIFSIINYIFLKTGFKIQDLIYYLILIMSGTFGSMVGISNKPNEEKEK
ncbi:MAG: TIGR04086 family membrane protein [Bacilli bacterium]|nr:TIGR04086 family membrane protein [Bacilli bacterium]MDD4809185.1 TIGR04086 family membrane protein [Bacilli bacterium]